MLENTDILDQHHLHILSQLFTELDPDGIAKVLAAGKTIHLRPGEYLFHQGDQANALYLVLSGRLRAVVQDHNGMHMLGDIGEGEPAGEFALFTKEPRMASVLAIRKTTLLEIDNNQYLKLVAQNPSFAGTLTSFLIKRLRRNVLEQHQSGTPKNIALINLQPQHDLSPWTNDIKKTLNESGIPTQVYDHDADAGNNIFDTLEQHEGLNILVCSNDYPEWSKHCLIYADLVIVATNFSADPGLYPIEQELDLYAQSILNRKIYIVFLHEQQYDLPRQTSRWLAGRNVNLHIHVRKQHPPDVRRFCRIISNQGVGVVLGGGGAKGYAHVGALEALIEAGIEFDFIGGTSAGALYGIGMSHCDFNFEKIDGLCRESARRKLTSNDYTWPILSVMSGKKMNAFIHTMFGDSELEDIWVNSYCVSTDFSASGARVHDRGLARKMIQASIAIPGVFPPVVIDQKLHVDGGVVDNLPIEPMYRYPVRHIIAISLSALTTRKVDYEEMPSAGRLFWDKLTGKKRFKVPGIASLIINSLTLHSRQKQELAKSKVSLYFELDLKGIGLLDDKKWRQTIQKGRHQIKEALAEVPEEEQFWLQQPFFERTKIPATAKTAIDA